MNGHATVVEAKIIRGNNKKKISPCQGKSLDKRSLEIMGRVGEKKNRGTREGAKCTGKAPDSPRAYSEGAEEAR